MSNPTPGEAIEMLGMNLQIKHKDPQFIDDNFGRGLVERDCHPKYQKKRVRLQIVVTEEIGTKKCRLVTVSEYSTVQYSTVSY